MRKEDSILILPADKGRAKVLLDKDKYIEDVLLMLSDTKTYKILSRDPTLKYKKQLANTLTRLKRENKITETQYDYLYPTSEITPRLYCTPTRHKQGNPLRPIVDYMGSIRYKLSRSLADY